MVKAYCAFILTETAHEPRYNVRSATQTKPKTADEREPGRMMGRIERSMND